MTSARRAPVAALLVAALALAGCDAARAGSAVGARGSAGPVLSRPTSSAPVGAPSTGAGPTRRRALLPPLSGGPTGPAHASLSASPQVAPPVRVRVPAIGVDSALQPLHRLANGELEPPAQWAVAGWYADGVRPGDVGPALIAGHVDSVSGPAVFYRLRDLRPGDRVDVLRADGSTAHFVVTSTARYLKRKFPTAAVYGPTAIPVLRLVTCTGDFDVSQRSYVDNLVVTAVPTG